MTHTSTEQPEALRLADKYEVDGFLQDHRFAQDHWCRQAAAELRRQQARIEELEAQLEAIGAGGVEPLRKCNKLHQVAEPAAPVVKPIKDAIDALVMAAFTEGGCSEHRMSEARIQTELRKKELRTLIAATQPAAQGMDSAISESVLEAVKAINRGNGDGRAYRAALGWIVAHLNQAVARSLAVDPSGKVALPLATAIAAQAKQGEQP